MDKKQFLDFCKREFESHGFVRQKKAFYRLGNNLLCGIDLQASLYGKAYYVDYYFFLDNFENAKVFPTHYESDIEGRIGVMTKTSRTLQGKLYITPLIKYEEYAEEDLKPYFDKDFEEEILPPLQYGRSYILENLNKKYFLTLHQEEVLRKLQQF